MLFTEHSQVLRLHYHLLQVRCWPYVYNIFLSEDTIARYFFLAYPLRSSSAFEFTLFTRNEVSYLSYYSPSLSVSGQILFETVCLYSIFSGSMVVRLSIPKPDYVYHSQDIGNDWFNSRHRLHWHQPHRTNRRKAYLWSGSQFSSISGQFKYSYPVSTLSREMIELNSRQHFLCLCSRYIVFLV